MAHASKECPGFRQSLARQMRDSLLGNPTTIFVDEGGAKGWRYTRAKSQNADWWQDLPPSLDRKELRRAMDAMEAGKPLKKSRREHRWLEKFVRHTRKTGWCATFKGTESPLCVSPEEPFKRGKKGGRVYLTLPEEEYRRVLLQACVLHETPNAFLQELVPRGLDADEVARIELDAARARMAASGGAGGTGNAPRLVGPGASGKSAAWVDGYRNVDEGWSDDYAHDTPLTRMESDAEKAAANYDPEDATIRADFEKGFMVRAREVREALIRAV